MSPAINPTEPSVWRDPRAIALMIAASLTVMTAATISPALPGLERQFAETDLNAWVVRMLVPAPSLAVIFVAPFCGAIADRSSRRYMLLAGLALFVIAGSAGLVLPTLPLILISRLVLGVALAMIMTAQSALLGDYFSGTTLEKVSGGQVSARNLGGLVFVLLAGFLATVGPRLPFVIYALPILVLPFFWRVIVDLPHDMPAATVDRLQVTPTSPRMVIWLACGQTVVTVLFFTMPTQLPFFLLAQGYTSPAMTGAALGTLMMSGGVTALFYSQIRARLGDIGNWAIGFGLMSTGFILLVTTEHSVAIFAGCGAIGAGYALSIPGFVVLALAATPPENRGRTGALLTGSVFLGQFLSPILSSPTLQQWGWQSSGLGLAGVLASFAVVCTILAFIVALRRPK